MANSDTAQETPRIDLFEFWRKFYETNEQTWTKAVKDVVSTREYAEAQGKMLETFLAFQKMLRDGMTTQMTTLNLPTRDDVARLGELIVGVEEKSDRIEDRLIALEERLAALEKSVARKLDDIGGHLSPLEARIADQGKKLEKKVEEMEGGLSRLESRLADHSQELDKRLDQVDQRLEGVEKTLARQPHGAPSEGVPRAAAPRTSRPRATSPTPPPEVVNSETAEKVE